MFDTVTGFFSTAEYASNALLGGVAVTGIFDRAYQAENVGGNGFASSQPQFVLPSASVPAVVAGLPLVVGIGSYLVVSAEPDGTGMTVLLLETAP